MATKQLLLLMLALILVGIAVAIAVEHFYNQQALTSKDGITTSIAGIALNAFQYKSRPLS